MVLMIGEWKCDTVRRALNFYWRQPERVQGMKIAERAWAIFDKTVTALMVLACALVIFDTLAVTVDVLLRYSLGITYTGLFEITEYSLLWMTFLATAWLLKNDGHIRVDLVLTRLHPRHRTILNSIASIICAILLGVITWYSVRLTLYDYQTGYTLASILEPPKWPIEIIIPAGYFLLFIELLRKTYGHLTSWKALSQGEQKQSDSPPRGES